LVSSQIASRTSALLECHQPQGEKERDIDHVHPLLQLN
jgi:hypothetical protein